MGAQPQSARPAIITPTRRGIMSAIPRRFHRHLEGWLFIGPVILGVLAFQFVPIVISMYSSLTRWDGLQPPAFIGLANYGQLIFNDPFFRTTLLNTVYFTLGNIPLTMLLALGLAVLCNQKLPLTTVFRTAFFIPYVSNVVAVSIVWFWVFKPDNGIVNSFLRLFGVAGPAWLTDLTWAMPAVILVSVWQGVGYPMVILLAGLQGISEDYYDAAKVDGASIWRRFRDITLPLLTPTLFFLLITQFIASFQVFGIIYVMTRGGPANATSVYIYYLYQNAFAFGKLGYASAMAWILFVLIATFTFIQWKLQKRWVFYE